MEREAGGIGQTAPIGQGSRIGRVLGWLDGKLSRVTSSREFIPEIDGLRFIAIFFVVVFHSAVKILVFQGRSAPIPNWAPGRSLILGIIGNLYLGVQVFFVISGFVVALPFARAAIQKAPKPSLGKYFMRRITRIEPPYILALLAMYYLNGQYRYYLPHLLAGLVYLHRLIYGFANPVNQVTWTLEIEVIFYILAPWITLIYLVPGRAARWSCQIVLLGADSYWVHNWLLPFGPRLSYLSFMAALPYFLGGILLADFYASGLLSRSRNLAWDVPALLSLPALIYCHYYGPAWRFAWLGPMMIMALAAGGIKGIVVGWFLRLRPIALIGGMCYSIYLWHIPILDKLYRFAAALPRGVSDLRLTALYCIVAIPMVLVLSVPIYYFIERPFMNGPGSRFIERVLRSAYARLRLKLNGRSRSTGAPTGLPAEPISQEQFSFAETLNGAPMPESAIDGGRERGKAMTSASQEQEAPGPIGRALGWLEGKLSRVTSSREFIPEIDGLRFIAIFFVLVFHTSWRILESQNRSPFVQQWAPGRSLIFCVIGNLFLGVQIFFVISGLVVALPFARSAIQGAPKPSLGRYFMRRLTRIEPPYILALLTMYYLRGQYRLYLPHLIAGLFYAHKWVFGTRNPINIVTWSLEIEVAFYILAPWITSIYSIPGRTVRWAWQLILIGAASYFVQDWLIPYGPPLSGNSFTASLPYFLAGVLLADFYVSGVLSRTNGVAWDGAALLGLAALLGCYVYGPAWRFTWLGPFLIAMLVAGGMKGIALNRFLRLRPITLIGGMCYTIYLWHTMFLWSTHIMERLSRLASWLYPHRLSDLRLTIAYGLVTIPLILLFCMPIFYFTERPFMNGPGSRFIERVLRGAYARVQSRLSGRFRPTEAETDLLVESIAHE